VKPLPIPHAEPFLFVGVPETVQEGSGLFRWDFPRLGETFALRMFPQLVCVEAMAQAAAALHGLAAQGEGGPPEAGTLASVDRVRFNGAPRPGDTLVIKVAVKRRYGELVLLAGEVWVRHRMVAQGDIVVRREVGGA